MTTERRKLLRVYRSMVKRAALAPRGKKQSRLAALRGWVHKQMKREIEGHKEQALKVEGVVKAKEAEREAVEKEMLGVQESWS
jgi:hypothetical protein